LQLSFGFVRHEVGDLAPELLLNFLVGGFGVLDRVVQQRRYDRRFVEIEIGQDPRDFQRVREVGIAGLALLVAVRFDAEHVSTVQQILVRIRIVGFDAFDEFELAHHGMKLLMTRR
jgi:hypothetical protein